MRKLMVVAILVGLGLLVARLYGQRTRWEGLTEAEAKAQLVERLSRKLDAERAEAVASMVVVKLREKGRLKDEQPSA